jgi:hypothetical protein
MSLPLEIIAPREGRGSKLGNLVRRLGSNNDGELVATVHAMRRAGYAMGMRDAENKQHGANDFGTTDGKPEWNDVALFLQRQARLDVGAPSMTLGTPAPEPTLQDETGDGIPF